MSLQQQIDAINAKLQDVKTPNEITSSTSYPTGAKVMVVDPAGTDGKIKQLPKDIFIEGIEQDLKDRTPVCVLDYGAVGDGVTDDTVAVQAALDTGRTVYFPSRSGYLVSQISLLDDQMIYGDSQHLAGIIGNGSGATTVLIGDGTGAIRRNVLRDIRIENPNGTAVYVDVAPNLNVDRCFIRGVQGDGLVLFLTYRTNVTNSSIGCSGDYVALRGLDNINGLVIQGNQISGGSAGTAIVLGRSQGVSIISNVIEVSKGGIWIASTNDTGAGNCNGVNLIGNYIEQCETPFKIATQFRVLGLNFRGNFISNTSFNLLPTRDSMITLGRIDSGAIENNSYYVSSAGDETVYNFELNSASTDVRGLSIRNNYINGTPLAMYKTSGAFGSNVSVLRNLGGENNFYFTNDNESLGSDQLKEWLSPVYDCANLTELFYSFISPDDMDFGGRIFAVEIVDYDGGDISDVELRVGTSRSGESGVIVLESDISSLTYSLGRADLSVVNGYAIRSDFDAQLRVKNIGVGSPVGKFRVKIKYRVN